MPMHESTDRRREKYMAKLIQICASDNDLFSLDAEGTVYHYNVNPNDWVRLGREQRDHGEPRHGQGQPGSAQSDVSENGGRADGETVMQRAT